MVGEKMIIHNNDELSNIINEIIQQSGYKKTYIAEKLGIANQNLNRLINKKNLSLDDAKHILNIVGYDAQIIIKKD